MFIDIPLPNIWLGVSIEDQQTADERITKLLQIPANVRWVSYEPALGAVDLTCLGKKWINHHPINALDDGIVKLTEEERKKYGMPEVKGSKLDWVVCGGESGHNARPYKIEWFEKVAEQCKQAGVPFFMKQLTKNGRKIPFKDFPKNLQIRKYPKTE